MWRVSRHIILVERGRRGDPFALWRLYEIVRRKATRFRLNLLLDMLHHTLGTLFQGRNATNSSAAPSSVGAHWRAARHAAHTKTGLRSVNYAPADTATAWCIQVVLLADYDCGQAAARPPASPDHTPVNTLPAVVSVQVYGAKGWPRRRCLLSLATIVAESVLASAVAAD